MRIVVIWDYLVFNKDNIGGGKVKNNNKATIGGDRKKKLSEVSTNIYYEYIINTCFRFFFLQTGFSTNMKRKISNVWML